jgi:hypothetical protein
MIISPPSVSPRSTTGEGNNFATVGPWIQSWNLECRRYLQCKDIGPLTSFMQGKANDSPARPYCFPSLAFTSSRPPAEILFTDLAHSCHSQVSALRWPSPPISQKTSKRQIVPVSSLGQEFLNVESKSLADTPWHHHLWQGGLYLGTRPGFLPHPELLG